MDRRERGKRCALKRATDDKSEAERLSLSLSSRHANYRCRDLNPPRVMRYASIIVSDESRGLSECLRGGGKIFCRRGPGEEEPSSFARAELMRGYNVRGSTYFSIRV